MTTDERNLKKDLAIAAVSNAVAIAESVEAVEINQICAWADDLYDWMEQKIDQERNRTNPPHKV